MFQCGWHDDPCTIISLQGIDIVSDGSGPIGFESLDGWEGGVAAHGGPEPWQAADGGVMGAVYHGPRTITIEGDIAAETHEEYAELVAELGAVLSRPRIDTLTVDESIHLGLVRQVQVTRTRPVQISQVGYRHGVFTLTVEAASHLRVGVDQHSVTVPPERIAVSNIGNADAAVSATLKGPLTNPGLAWNGNYWLYMGEVPSGQTLEVDMSTQVVRDPATKLHSTHRASGDWVALPPGETLINKTGTGSGSIQIRWRSSWT